MPTGKSTRSPKVTFFNSLLYYSKKQFVCFSHQTKLNDSKKWSTSLRFPTGIVPNEICVILLVHFNLRLNVKNRHGQITECKKVSEILKLTKLIGNIFFLHSP